MISFISRKPPTASSLLRKEEILDQAKAPGGAGPGRAAQQRGPQVEHELSSAKEHDNNG
jgi:hypothetical protein